MSPLPRSAVLLGLAVLLAPGAPARGSDVEIAPFVGAQHAGSYGGSSTGVTLSSGVGLDFGGTVDLEVAPGWRVELLYSRQEAELASGGGPRLDLDLERYMAGIVEEKGDDRTRFFGVFLLGLTRFGPGWTGRDADARFTLGLSLGLKRALSGRFGLRMEARGFFVVTEGQAGGVCNGSCVFVYRGSGNWQGDVSAGILMAF